MVAEAGGVEEAHAHGENMYVDGRKQLVWQVSRWKVDFVLKIFFSIVTTKMSKFVSTSRNMFGMFNRYSYSVLCDFPDLDRIPAHAVLTGKWISSGDPTTTGKFVISDHDVDDRNVGGDKEVAAIRVPVEVANEHLLRFYGCTYFLKTFS